MCKATTPVVKERCMTSQWRQVGDVARHYCDVIMNTIASQITSLTIVYLTVNSGTDQRKHQSSTSLAFVRGIHRRPVNSPHKGPVMRKMFPFDDVIMDLVVILKVFCVNTSDITLFSHLIIGIVHGRSGVTATKPSWFVVRQGRPSSCALGTSRRRTTNHSGVVAVTPSRPWSIL